MINKKMEGLGKVRSVIRDLFEYGKARKAELGEDKVFDFSLGNPSVPAPDCVTEVLLDLIQNESPLELHGYSSAQGDFSVRKAISDYINENYGTAFTPNSIYMTVGAAAGLTISLNALVCEGDEVIAFAPFFPEYRVFSEAADAIFKALPPCADFSIDIKALENAITESTKALIVNSPNNPSGVVLSEDCIIALCELLKKKSAEYGHPIYIIADEPYRELVYDDIKVPYITNYYDNTLVCYSFSKSLSLPGERIGYIAVPPAATDSADVYAAVCGAGRALGYVCAPTLFQRVAARCLGKTADVSVYRHNRDLIYNALCSYGFECVKPDGAFYLFMKAAEADAKAFSERAKKHELLLVPADSFGCEGYVRISYCVSTEQIENSLPAFKALAEEYGLIK